MIGTSGSQFAPNPRQDGGKGEGRGETHVEVESSSRNEFPVNAMFCDSPSGSRTQIVMHLRWQCTFLISLPAASGRPSREAIED